MNLLPEWLLHTEFFAVASTFVALNTVMYLVLSILKLLPPINLGDLLTRRGTRSETRSIHPDGPL